MSDEFTDFLNGVQQQAPSKGPVPVTSGAGKDEFTNFLQGGDAGPAETDAGIDAAVNEAPQDPLTKFVQTGVSQPGYMDLFTSGLHRGWVQAKAAIPSVKSVVQDLSGDSAGAVASAQEAQGILKEAGDSTWELKNIQNPDDFLRWTVEKLGEQGVNVGAMLVTGGSSAVATGLATRALLARGLISESTAKAIVTAGTVVPTYGVSTGMETAGTTQEQFEVTGSPQSGLSLGAGAAKGVLELWTPLSILKALKTPGAQLGNSLLGGIGKTALKEGGTEAAQEAIDIAARKYNDPGYSFFGNGPDWWNGPGFQRMVEAGAAGAVVGGVYGAPAVAIERGQSAGVDPETGLPNDKPGTRTLLPGSAVRAPINQAGPVTQLRDLVIPKQGEDKLLNEALQRDPRDDAWSLGPLVADTFNTPNREALLDLIEANTPRFVEVGADGKLSSRLMTDTEIELNTAMNKAQAERPRLLRVDQSSLQPAGITADVFDLPASTSGRVWFLPGTSPQEQQQLQQQYEFLQEASRPASQAQLTTKFDREKFESIVKPIYDKLLKRGLRVVPSRGSGFYYDGLLKGEEVTDLSTTGRTQQIGLYDPVSQKVTPFFTKNEDLQEWEGENVIPGAIIVSVDVNKLKPEDVVFGKDSKAFVLRKPLRPEVLTPGIKIQDAGEIFSAPVAFQLEDGIHTYMAGVNPENEELGLKLRSMSDKMAAPIEKILTEINVPTKLAIIITDEVEETFGVDLKTTALMHVDGGAVYLFPKNFSLDFYNQKVDLETDLLSTLMHEIGHQVTYYHFRGLPTEIQQQLSYAWNKANLASRMSPMRADDVGSSKADALGVTNQQTLRDYYLTFPEWLAEQFRRWSTSDAIARSYTDRAFKEGAAKLERFYKEWEARFGRQSRLDVEQPDYAFSAAMDYLRGVGSEKQRLQSLLKQQVLLSVSDSLFESPASLRITEQVRLALESMKEMFPEEVKVSLSERLSPHLHQSGEAAASWNPQLSLIELAVASLPAESAFADSRVYFAHELMHAYEDLGLITAEELKILDKDIAVRPDRLGGGYKAALHKRVIGFADAQRNAGSEVHTKLWADDKYQEMLAREQRAYYIQDFADTGSAESAEARGIITRLLATLERVRNFLQGLGFQTAEDVRRAFFKGEMVAREDRAAELSLKSQAAILHMNAIAQMKMDMLDNPASTYQVGDMFVTPQYDGSGVDYKKTSPHIFYHWKDSSGKLVGILELRNRGQKGFEIAWLESDKILLGARMLAEAERDLGMQMLVSGELTAAGRAQAELLLRKQGKGGLIKLWQKVKMTNAQTGVREEREFYVSPNIVLENVAYWSELARSRVRQEALMMTSKDAQDRLAEWTVLYNNLPKEIWTDGTLDKMFSLRRNHERDGVQGSILRAGMRADESKLLTSMGQGSAKSDAFTNTLQLKAQLSQAENAKASGLPFELSAPSTMLTYEAWGIGKLFEGSQTLDGYNQSASAGAQIKNLKHEADRIGKFSKMFLGLNQLAWNNKHITYLQKYNELNNIGSNIATALMRKADETARVWDKVKAERKEALADVLFKLSEMDYLLSVERAAKVVRPPANWNDFLSGVPPIPRGELDRMFKAAKLTLEEINLVRRVQNDFSEFLSQVEYFRNEQLKKTLSRDPKTLAVAQAKLASEMTELRQKPYFPMIRFGEFTLAVRDPAQKNKVVAAYAYDTQRQRDAAVSDVRRIYQVEDIIIGRVPESASEFMGLPGPLLRAIKEDMVQATGQKLTQEQLVWLEEYEMLTAPDRSFKKRWMPAKGVPGHSMDAFRAYAHYFQNGARYLGRLATMDDMQASITAVENSISSGGIGNTAKRQAIASYMRDHFRYVMEPGRDSAKFRAFFAMYHLGFSGAAAAMNLTQIPTVLIPWLSHHFGVANGYAALGKAGKALREAAGIATGNASFQRAREEMISQGRIDVGQAPELGAFAEGHNLNKLSAGTRTQKFWRQTSWLGMVMFSAVEHYNREFSFKAAWDLAIANPNMARLQEIDRSSILELGDIQRRTGLSHTEAVAFLFARETIDMTQFQYAKHSDAPFMRGPVRKDFLIFFKYMQNMLFALRYSGAGVHMLVVLAFLYGLNGLPGSDEFNELLRLLANKLFGKDFDLKLAARRQVRELTRGTIFNEVGPDVAMHGISRYGFGLGLLPQSWGAPSFDASANGSMGRIVPGLSEYMHGAATGRKMPEVLGDSAQRAAGAGYGTIISLMQFLMSDPFSADQKQWEQLFPRSVRSLSKAYRYGFDPAAETTKGGAKIVKFDITDPNDLTTVLTQAIGFTPTKVSETWDLIRVSRETMQIFQARKSAIYAQMDKAVQAGDAGAVDDMLKAVRDFNEAVRESAPNLQISGPAVLSALRNRAKSKEMQEQFLSPTKREVLITDRLRDLYPGVGAQKVK